MSQQADPDTDMLPEYDFSHGVRGKHYKAYRAGTNVVFLDPDVAKTFRDSASVNRALRLLIEVAHERVPHRRVQTPAIKRTGGGRKHSAAHR